MSPIAPISTTTHELSLQADPPPEFQISPPSGLMDTFTCLSLRNFKASMLHNL